MDKYQRIQSFLEDPINEPDSVTSSKEELIGNPSEYENARKYDDFNFEQPGETTGNPVNLEPSYAVDSIPPVQLERNPDPIIQDSVSPQEQTASPTELRNFTTEPFEESESFSKNILTDFKRPRFTQATLDRILKNYADKDDIFGHKGFALSLIRNALHRKGGLEKGTAKETAKLIYKGYREGTHKDVLDLKEKYNLGNIDDAFKGLTDLDIINLLADDPYGKPIRVGDVYSSFLRQAVPETTGVLGGALAYNAANLAMQAASFTPKGFAAKIGVPLASIGLGHIGGYLFGDMALGDAIAGKRQVSAGGTFDRKKQGEILAASIFPSFYGLGLGTRLMKMSPSTAKFISEIGESSVKNKVSMGFLKPPKGFVDGTKAPKLSEEHLIVQEALKNNPLSAFAARFGIGLQENVNNPVLTESLGLRSALMLGYLGVDLAGAFGSSAGGLSEFATARVGSDGETLSEAQRAVRDLSAQVVGDIGVRGTALITQTLAKKALQNLPGFVDKIKSRLFDGKSEMDELRKQGEVDKIAYLMFKEGEDFEFVVDALKQADKNSDLSAGQISQSPTILSIERSLDLANPEGDDAMLRNMAQILKLTMYGDEPHSGNDLVVMADFVQSLHSHGLKEAYQRDVSNYLKAVQRLEPGNPSEVQKGFVKITKKHLEAARMQEKKLWEGLKETPITYMPESSFVTTFDKILKKARLNESDYLEFIKAVGGEKELQALTSDVNRLRARVVDPSDIAPLKTQVKNDYLKKKNHIFQTDIFSGKDFKSGLGQRLQKLDIELENQNASYFTRAEKLQEDLDNVINYMKQTQGTEPSRYSKLSPSDRANFDSTVAGWRKLINLNSNSDGALLEKAAERFSKDQAPVDEADFFGIKNLIALRSNFLNRVRTEQRNNPLDPNTPAAKLYNKLQAAILQDLNDLPKMLGDSFPNRTQYDNARAYSYALNEFFIGRKNGSDKLLHLHKLHHTNPDLLVGKIFTKDAYGKKLVEVKQAADWLDENVYNNALAKELNILDKAPTSDLHQQSEIMAKLIFKKAVEGKATPAQQRQIINALNENPVEGLAKIDEALLNIDEQKLKVFRTEYKDFFEMSPELNSIFEDVSSTRKLVLDVLDKQSDWNKTLETKKAFYSLTRKTPDGERKYSLNDILNNVSNSETPVYDLDSLVDEIEKVDLDQALKLNPKMTEETLKLQKDKAKQSIKTGILDYILYKGGIDQPYLKKKFNPAQSFLRLIEPFEKGNIPKGKNSYLDWMVSRDIITKEESKLLGDSLLQMVSFLQPEDVTPLFENMPVKTKKFLEEASSRFGFAKMGVAFDKLLGIGSPLVSAGIMSSQGRKWLDRMGTNRENHVRLMKELMEDKSHLADMLVISQSNLNKDQQLEALKEWAKGIMAPRNISREVASLVSLPTLRFMAPTVNKIAQETSLLDPEGDYSTLQDAIKQSATERKQKEARSKATEDFIRANRFKNFYERNPNFNFNLDGSKIQSPPPNIEAPSGFNLFGGKTQDPVNQGIAQKLTPEQREELMKSMNMDSIF